MSEGEYIRGAGAARVDPRRIGWVLASATVVALAVAAILLLVSAASSDSAAAKLRRDGVPVAATVTRCTGISSGIGMGVVYYQCDGTFTLQGATFAARIRGERAQIPPGAAVPARVVPGDPSSLTLASAVPSASSSSSVGAYTSSIVLGTLTVAGAATLVIVGRRGRVRRRAAA